MKLDLADTASIRRFVHNFRKRFADLDILINNAGIITQNYQRTKQGLESIGGTNYFGHYLLMRLLLPGFGKGSDKRIINLITCIYPLGRRYRFKKLQHYRWVRAYAVSKYMILQSTLALAPELSVRGICINAVDPGIVNTEIMFTKKWYDFIIHLILLPFYISLEQGARRIVDAACAPEYCGVGGQCLRGGKAIRLRASDRNPAALGALLRHTDETLGLKPL